MRPHLCPDTNCKILHCTYDRKRFDEGASFICYGKILKPHIFLARTTEHVNEYSNCIYTPLKGLIRFFINRDDAWADFIGCGKVMDDATQLVCDECGPVSRRNTTVTTFLDKSKLCNFCAVRLHKIEWHPDEKKYY